MIIQFHYKLRETPIEISVPPEVAERIIRDLETRLGNESRIYRYLDNLVLTKGLIAVTTHP